MTIIIENITSDIITINDLGIELQSNESIDLLLNFSEKEILFSNDLENSYNNNEIEITLDSNIINYDQLIDAINSLSKFTHENLDTLKHNLSEQSHFIVTRNNNDEVDNIIYYTDNTLTIKIRQEEIIRDSDGNVIQLKDIQYDNDNNIIRTEIQTINRDQNGQFISIDSIII